MDMPYFIVALKKIHDKPLYEQLIFRNKRRDYFKTESITGTKLPSKRKLADFLNISRTTVELAYAQLLAEGYISAKPRVGYFVEALDELPYVEKMVPKFVETSHHRHIVMIFHLVKLMQMHSRLHYGANMPKM